MAYLSQHDDKAEVYSLSERRVGNGAGAVTASLGGEDIKGYTENDRRDMRRMGKKQVRFSALAQMLSTCQINHTDT